MCSGENGFYSLDDTATPATHLALTRPATGDASGGRAAVVNGVAPAACHDRLAPDSLDAAAAEEGWASPSPLWQSTLGCFDGMTVSVDEESVHADGLSEPVNETDRKPVLYALLRLGNAVRSGAKGVEASEDEGAECAAFDFALRLA